MKVRRIAIDSFWLVVAAMVTGLSPVISNAGIWNAVTDFTPSNPSGLWSYGYGVTGSLFTPYGVFQTPCDAAAPPSAGPLDTSCRQIAPGAATAVPLVGINNTAGTLDIFGMFSTIVLPKDVLWMHPGPGTVESIVQWTAPAAGMYSISGFFELLDDHANGVFVKIYDNNTPEFTPLLPLTGPAAPPSTPGGKDSFALTLSLNPGDVIYFGVNNAGNYFYDSTGLAATITAVPEPTSLSLFASGLAGFWWLRKRRCKVLMRNC
jgi:PEP-CTERM motif-containing protein